MKKVNYILFLVAIVFATACSTDFEITNDFEEFTIVYGILNQNNASNFIRIQKAFLDEETSALEIAQVNDSLFHSYPLNPKLIEIQPNSGNQTRTIMLQLVNADTLGIEKEEGVFSNTPNLLYRTNASLRGDRRYRIEVETEKGKVFGATNMISDFEVVTPNPDFSPNMNVLNNYKITFEPTDNAFLYDISIDVFYREISGQNISNKSFVWQIEKNISIPVVGFTNIQHEVEGEGLLDAMLANIEENGLLERQIDSVNLTITAGSEALDLYNRSIIAQQTGITSGQAVVPFSNIENGLGLVASTFSKTIYDLDFSQEVKDELSCNERVRHLNFLPENPAFNCE